MLWIIAKSGKLEKKKVRRNLVGARSLDDLGTSGRLGLEGLLLFMYPTFSSGLLTAWRVAERFYAEGFGFLFDNTSCVVQIGRASCRERVLMSV